MESDCIFCKIIKGIAPAEFVYEDADIVAFKDIHPHAPVHLLVVPRKHIRSVNDLAEEESLVLTRMLWIGKSMAEKQGIKNSGYKLLFNVERGGGQVIFHLHLHVLGGW